MQDYDFKVLNDKEFEAFCVDLISSEMGKRFERFKPGRDHGVDGRYFHAPGQESIIQCKHWINTPIEQLIRHLRTTELQKVKKLNPKHYLLAVSNPLSRADKSAIKDALHPYIKNDSDIYGREDLNDLLNKHKSIELRHYKLWISSTSVLQYLLNKPILDRSSFALEEAISNTKTYAPTSNHERAIEKLDKLGIIIITGEPGIGKTTLAEQICLNYATRDYAIIKISEEIREAESLYQAEENQVFYFDDFLGRNYLEALSGHEGSHIVSFMRRISKDRNTKKFILTSRSTILNQGKILIDLFKDQSIEKNEYELSANLLTEIDRAKILYNQMWHSGLSDAYLDEIYSKRRYREIVKHQNFNPRLIKFILDPDRIDHISAQEYWDYILKTLRNPIEVWENPFDAQQDDFSRAITLIVALNGRETAETELSEAYSRYISLPENANLRGRRDFLTNVKHLTGSLLNRKINLGEAEFTYDLFNPSLGDFLLKRYSHDTPSLRSAFISLRSLSSLATLENLASNKIISLSANLDTQIQILKHASTLDFSGYSPEYISKILIKTQNHPDQKKTLKEKAINFISTEPIPTDFKFTASVINISLKEGILSPQLAADFIVKACDNSPVDEELISLLSTHQTLSKSGVKTDVIRSFLEEAIISYFENNIYEELDDSKIFRSIDYDDIETAEENLLTLISERLSNLGVDWEIECESILEAYDIYSRRDYYFAPDEEPDYRAHAMQGSYIDEIDDLFSRN
jgi:adenylate kinase family enzyme